MSSRPPRRDAWAASAAWLAARGRTRSWGGPAGREAHRPPGRPRRAGCRPAGRRVRRSGPRRCCGVAPGGAEGGRSAAGTGRTTPRASSARARAWARVRFCTSSSRRASSSVRVGGAAGSRPGRRPRGRRRGRRGRCAWRLLRGTRARGGAGARTVPAALPAARPCWRGGRVDGARRPFGNPNAPSEVLTGAAPPGRAAPAFPRGRRVRTAPAGGHAVRREPGDPSLRRGQRSFGHASQGHRLRGSGAGPRRARRPAAPRPGRRPRRPPGGSGRSRAPR